MFKSIEGHVNMKFKKEKKLKENKKKVSNNET